MSNANVEVFLHGVSDAAILVRSSGEIVVCNAAFAELVGMRPRKLRQVTQSGDASLPQFLQLELDGQPDPVARCIERQRPIRLGEIAARATAGDDSELTLQITVIPIFSDGGEVSIALQVFRDVTAEARVQERFKILLDRERNRAQILEEQVRERTKELSRSLDELKQTRAQLVRSEKFASLGQLVAGVAHELNNPINFIYGNVSFLKTYLEAYGRLFAATEELGLSDQDRAALEKVKQENDFDYVSRDIWKVLDSIGNGAERAGGIIQGLRAYMHGGDAEHSSVNLAACIDSTLTLLRHETKDKVKVEKDIGPDATTAHGNEGQVNQVMMNLFVNALQAMGGQGTLRIGLHVDEDSMIRLDVQDTGEGMTEEVQLRAFDPFFTTKSPGEGTGLGLSVCYSIVDAHGGRMAIDSTVGTGSTVSVWLPKSAD